jgi:hypothetical protein
MRPFWRGKQKHPARRRDGMQQFPRYHPYWPRPGGPLCSQQPAEVIRRLAPQITPGLRPGLMNHRSLMIVPPGSSGGNFDQVPPGGGLSLSPTLPCRFPLVYFPPSSLFEVNCSPNYLQKTSHVKGLMKDGCTNKLSPNLFFGVWYGQRSRLHHMPAGMHSQSH